MNLGLADPQYNIRREAGGINRTATRFSIIHRSDGGPVLRNAGTLRTRSHLLLRPSALDVD